MKKITKQAVLNDIKDLERLHDGVPFGNILWANDEYRSVMAQRVSYEEKKKVVDVISDQIQDQLDKLAGEGRIIKTIPQKGYGKIRYYVKED